jgi:hypothetical protein
MLDRDEHPAKHEHPRSVIESGMLIVEIKTHPEKHESPNKVIESEMLISESDEHP